jgi:hypothetical protein
MRSEKQPFSILKKLILVLIIILVLLIAGYLILLNAGAKKEIVAINNEFGSEKTKNASDEKLYSNPEFLELQKKKGFLQARILMAEADSVNLSLNLRDSIAALEIHGVSVYSTHISKIEMSSVFRNADEYSILQMFSKPFEVQQASATIKKESLLINIAPKDTIEANVPTVLPDTSAVESASFILLMNNNVKLYVYQEEVDSIPNKTLFMFDLKDRLAFLKAATKNMMDFKIPEYQPYIKIRLRQKDIKTIYTAIASKALVSIYF